MDIYDIPRDPATESASECNSINIPYIKIPCSLAAGSLQSVYLTKIRFNMSFFPKLSHNSTLRHRKDILFFFVFVARERVRLVVHIHKVGYVDVGILLGRRQRGVSEEFLYHP